MAKTFLWYPRCSTCVKAKKWLEEKGIEVSERLIVEDNPTADEIAAWKEKSGLPLKKFFNTSGKMYREENMKDFIATHTEEEQIEKLAISGMLVKRPLLVLEDSVLVGFKVDEWEKALLK